MRKFAVKMNNPALPFEVNGSGKFYKHLFVDSIAYSWKVSTQEIQTVTAIITGNAQIDGALSVGGILSSNKIHVSGTSVFDLLSGTVDGIVLTDKYGALKRLSFTGSSGDILLGNGTFGNISSVTGWQWVGTDLLSIANDVYVPNSLFVGKSISIGPFKIKNGGTRDTIRTAVALAVVSDAQRIEMLADTVTMREYTRVGSDTSKYAPPVSGKIALQVAGSATVTGDVAVKGNFSTGAISANNLTANNTISSPKIVTSRITSPDSVIRFGDSSIVIYKSYNWITTTSGPLQLTASNPNPHVFIGGFASTTLIGSSFGGSLLNFGQRNLQIVSHDWAGAPSFPNGLRIEKIFWTGSLFNPTIAQRSTWDMVPVTPQTSQPRLEINAVTSNKTVMTLTEDGNVGIGTTSPSEKLDVDGKIRLRTGATTGYILVSNFNGVGTWTPPAAQASDGDWNLVGNDIINANIEHVIVGTQQLQPASPHYLDYKMSVSGKFVAQKIISTQNDWADDELQKNLTTEDLDIEEKFAKQKSHLQGVPPGKEIEADGLDISAMSSIQMRKIEQIFLYLFNFKNIIKELHKENKQLKDKIDEMEKRIEMIEKANGK